MILLPIFSALLCAISLPNELFLTGFWPTGFIALAPLYIALLRARSPRRAALSGAIFGALSHGLTSYWLFFYKDFAFWTLGSTTLAYAVVYAAIAMYGSFLLRSEFRAYRPFLFAIGWAAFEYLKSSGFLGYPWGLIPYSLSSVPLLLQTADTTGLYGLSFLLALSSAIAAELLTKERLPRRPFVAGKPVAPGPPAVTSPPEALSWFSRLSHLGSSGRFDRPEESGGEADFTARAAAFLAFSFFIVLVYGLVSFARPIPQKTTLRATLVQQNTDPWLSGEMPVLQSNIELARQAYETNKAVGGQPVDLVVFSETSFQRPFAEYRRWFALNPKPDPLLPFLAESGSQLLTGAPIVLDWDKYLLTNSVILLSSQGALLDSYAKIHPVPFAEAIPLWEYEWFRKFMQNVVGLESGWVMGDRVTIFSMTPKASNGMKVNFGTPICFEDAFADLCRQYFLKGADLLINLTNDSWSRTQSAQIQHWAIARIRAIENRRTLVRSTNSGVSCVVDAWGNSLYEMPQFEARAITVDIPIYAPPEPTLYTTYGDWFAKLCTLLLALGGVLNCIRFRKRIACAGDRYDFY
ncbi:MAG TPA: apolipoprotein N-acyltransferase [Rectinemataceae bacterium]|nr:apolipoprotein N-acyltransferase [Rectinemataceae bacterium]